MAYRAHHATEGPIGPSRATRAAAYADLLAYIESHWQPIARQLMARASTGCKLDPWAFYSDPITWADDPGGMAEHQSKMMLWRYCRVK